MISPILPWWTSAGERAPVAASANRSCTSRARTSRPLIRYTDPASRSIRREISRISRSFIAAGAERSALSIVITTSAWLLDERLEPVKAKAREFHGHGALLARRESPCRDNTIEGNVGVWASRFGRLSWPTTMARPGPKGNRRPGLFPRLLSQAFYRAYRKKALRAKSMLRLA